MLFRLHLTPFLLPLQSNYYGSGDKTAISYKIYIFDVQNVAELLNGSRPVVVEQGPYAFHEYFNKVLLIQ